MSGTLFVVATPIGNLEDISARALRVLREASIIAAEDTRRTAHLLAHYGISTPTTSLHEHNETKKAGSLLARLERGESVALVSDAGTPAIADPGQGLIAAALAAGIRVEPIPGPNAAIAALAASGLPSETFAFMGFPPPRSKARSEWFARVRAIGGTVVFYEAPHRIRQTMRDLQHHVGECQVVVCREMTKIHEQLVKGQISTVLDALSSDLGEFTVVVDIGLSTNIEPPQAVDERALMNEFGEMTKSGQFTRRRAVAALAKLHHMRPNEVYALLERGKQSPK